MDGDNVVDINNPDFISRHLYNTTPENSKYLMFYQDPNGANWCLTNNVSLNDLLLFKLLLEKRIDEFYYED